MAKRKVRPLRILILFFSVFAVLVLALSLGYYLIINRRDAGNQETIESMISQANEQLSTILSMSAPDNLSAESFALVQDAARKDILDYTASLTGFLSDGVTSEEVEEAKALDSPLDEYQLIFDNIAFYPQAVITVFNKDRDNLDFLVNYAVQEPYLTPVTSIDLSENPPKLTQTDPGWAFMPYQNGIIGTDGSLPTALAIIAASQNNDSSITPYTIAQISDQLEETEEEREVVLMYSLDLGYYYGLEDPGDNQLISAVTSQYHLNQQSLDLTAEGLSLALDKNIPVLAQTVAYADIDESKIGHDYVVLYKKEGDQVWMIDPSQPSRDEQSYKLQDLLDNNIIKAVAIWK